MTPDLLTFAEAAAAGRAVVGGKAEGLGQLAAAGLPVPPGFVVTTACYRRFGGGEPDADFRAALCAAYERLGGGPMAVRSSATAEDAADASFAGLQETVLGVEGDAALLLALRSCWESLGSERALAYRQQQGVASEGLAMAVVVQRLIDAEVAGVLFTRDPLDPTAGRMVVEAAWGLGESVVAGRVQPDRFTLDRTNNAILSRAAGHKSTKLTASGERPVPVEQQSALCLTDAQLVELAVLGRRVEELFGAGRDMEWAYANGQFWLLQARPITTSDTDDREQIRLEEIGKVLAKAEPGGTVWASILLAEELPEPMPMTWAIVRRFLSGTGGYGLMYRDLGFRPAAALADETIYDLVAGRTYCNLSREPRMQFGNWPIRHNFAKLKAEPARALEPTPELDMAGAGLGAWLKLPLIAWRLGQAARRVRALGATFAEEFRLRILPPYLEETARAADEDLSRLDGPALLARLEHWIQRTLVEFARDSLKPTVLAAAVLQSLGAKRATTSVGELALGVRPSPEADLGGAVRDLGAGRLSKEEFLRRFGHRGQREMELASPRWREDSDALDRMVSDAPRSEEPVPVPEQLDAERQRLATYLALREEAKHHLMRGYALIRQTLVEIDCRHGLAGDIFFLVPEELPRLLAGDDLTGTIARRRRRRRALALSLEVPPILFSDDLDAIGRPASSVLSPSSSVLQGIPLSTGVAEGPALVLREPTAAPAGGEAYVLVCPSTDPAWVPLFVRACAVVLEMGGVLSHGAIVAREFGLPAVAGLPGLTRQVRTGQRLRVDGARGTVSVLSPV